MNTRQSSQKGFVAIIMVMFISIMISLMTIGFARVIMKGQQRALNSQLNTQAFYAAESGINDAIQDIKDGYVPPATDTNCAPLNTGRVNSGNKTVVLDKAIPIAYTCQLVSSGVKDIQYDAGSDVPRSFPIYTQQPMAGKNLIVEWEQDANYLTAIPASPTNVASSTPTVAAWGKRPAMLRVTLYYFPVATGTPITRDMFNDDANQKTFYLNPASIGNDNSVISIAGTEDGKIIDANCEASPSALRPYSCRASLNFAGLNHHPEVYNASFIRIMPMYHKTAVNVYVGTAGNFNESSANRLTLYNAQYSIDVTGQANKLYKRLLVRIPFKDVTYPPTGVQSNGLCKVFLYNKYNNRAESEASKPNYSGVPTPGNGNNLGACPY
jgi:hypothetical protein